MQLYNTLTRKKEPFTPITPGKVGLYACGITAYDLCHIGHARSAVVFDVLVRRLRDLGLDVTFVRNFTDVDDKIINRANKDGVPSEEIAERYIAAFHEDMDRLNVLRANIEPKATEHIPDMIALCENLIAKGHAYSTPSGDVYFRVRSFPTYGKLSGRSLDELLAGARVAPGEEKEDPLDFALWKGAKPGEPSWESPWGPGRPGWHIECSAMSEKHLPLPLDIHGGGQDLIFPHHENEIAQTEAATGKDFAKYWVHNGFVQIDSEKMSKSLGNFKTIRDILHSWDPEVLRLFLLSRHYRSPIDFTVDGMEEVEKNYKRQYETLARMVAEFALPAPSGGKVAPETRGEFETLAKARNEALDDDLNTAAALGHASGLFRLAGRILDDKALRKNAGGRELLHDIHNEILSLGSVLGLWQREPAAFLTDLRACRIERRHIDTTRVQSLLDTRNQAKAAKDFAAADAVRAELAALGVEVRDTPEGVIWDIA